MNLSDFYGQLERFDWFYEMSDDGSTYRRGRAEETKVLSNAETSPAHQALYDAYRKYVWGGVAAGTEKSSKPERPV